MDIEVEKEKARLIFKAFGSMGFDIVGARKSDFTFGFSFLEGLAREYRVRVICANLLNPDKKSPLYAPHALIKKRGKRVLITSVLDPAFSTFPEYRARITNPVSAIKTIRDTVAHDIFIVVLHTNEKTAEKWLQQLTGVHMAVLGQEAGVKYKREIINGALLVYNNRRGRIISYVDISLSENNQGITIGSHETKYVDANLIPQDGTIQKMIADFDSWRLKRKHGQTKKQKLSFYLGKDWCVRCHKEIVASWEKTAHARAFTTLVRKGGETDPKCLSCHVTGINDKQAPGGFILAAFTQHMANVQCECCHGPAGNHVHNETGRAYGKKISESICVGCHNPERDSKFDFENDKRMGTH